jgi:low affinity Fe/Cu permease
MQHFHFSERRMLEPQDRRFHGWFSNMAGYSAHLMGTPTAFVIATVSVVLWAFAGPLFGYSDSWQLVINTVTTVLTFLAVFLIQHSQNRDGQAIQLKLDELIRSSHRARNSLIDLEHCTEEEMAALQKEFEKYQSRKGGTRQPAERPAQP